ncbi:MAG: energy transducer TonB [Saprospiraceae bacterium]
MNAFLVGNSEQPLFPGCGEVPEMEKRDCSQSKMMEYVDRVLKFPDILVKEKIEGKVYVKFIVSVNGFIAKSWIERSLHPAADQAALDVVKSMNEGAGQWTPGRREGSLVNMEVLLPITFLINPDAEGKIFPFAQEMPRFPGCEHLAGNEQTKCANEAMFQFIQSNLKYPSTDRAKSIQGMVLAKFVVRTDGRITNASISRGVSSTIDAEVLRLIQLMNSMTEKWIPGRHEGKMVNVEFLLPVKFSLN